MIDMTEVFSHVIDYNSCTCEAGKLESRNMDMCSFEMSLKIGCSRCHRRSREIYQHCVACYQCVFLL